MPFTWNVQPYERLSELREQYTSTVILATRKRSETIAAEATQWMKENAPWQDRPEILRNRLKEVGPRGGRPRLSPNAPHAREALKAYVIAEPGESDRAKGRAFKEAELEDEATLRELNREVKERIRRAEQASKTLMDRGEIAKGQRILGLMAGDKRYQLQTSLPKYKSSVKRFETEWRGMLTPLLRIKFTYGDRVNYDIWLEIANQGRYGIISKALDYWSPKLMAEVRSIANLKQYRDRIVQSETTISPEEIFEAHVDEWNRTEDKPYRPWTKERQETNRLRNLADRRRAINNPGNQSTKVEKGSVSDTGSKGHEGKTLNLFDLNSRTRR